MDHAELKAVVEALLSVSQEPMTMGTLSLVLGEAGVDNAALAQAIEALQADYAVPTRGLELWEVAGGYQFRTKAHLARWIQRLDMPKPTRLSQPAMETLAIIAYRQPIVRAEIEEIRGVDCGGVLKTLLERNLIKIVGKREDPGSPLLYGSTKEFLALFGLENLAALPSLKDYHELEHRIGVEPAAAAEEPTAEVDAPIAPITVEQQIAMEQADQAAIDELEEQIRSLRRLERDVFPSTAEQEASEILAEQGHLDPLPAVPPSPPALPASGDEHARDDDRV